MAKFNYKKREEVEKLAKLRQRIDTENRQNIARARIKIEQDVAAYEQSKRDLDASLQKCKGEAPQSAAADIDRTAQIGQSTPEDIKQARDELRRMGLNESQIEAIINQM